MGWCDNKEIKINKKKEEEKKISDSCISRHDSLGRY